MGATVGCSCRVPPAAAAAAATAAAAADTPTTAGKDGTLLLDAVSAPPVPPCCCAAVATKGPVRDCLSGLLLSAGAAPVAALLLPPMVPSPVPAFAAAADAASNDRGDRFPATAAADRGLVGSCRRVPAARRLLTGSGGGTNGCSGPFSCCTWRVTTHHRQHPQQTIWHEQQTWPVWQ